MAEKVIREVDVKTGNPPVSQKARSWATWIIALGAIFNEVVVPAVPQIMKEFPDTVRWLPRLVFVLGLVWLAMQRTSDASNQSRGLGAEVEVKQ